MIDRFVVGLREAVCRSCRAISLASVGLVGVLLPVSPRASANPGDAVVQKAQYSTWYRDRAHGESLPDAIHADLSPWFRVSTDVAPISPPARYFGSAESGVDPISLRQFTRADVTSVHSPYLGPSFAGPWPSSTDAAKPIYTMSASQLYAFKVTGGTPGDTVTVQMEATVQASGASNFFAGARVSFADYAGSFFGLTFYTLSQAFSASASDGTGVNAPWDPLPVSPQHTFTLLSGSLNGTGTIMFDVIADQEYLIALDSVASTYDQEGSSAHAFADPLLSISPSTPNAGAYGIAQSLNIAAVPEIDPASFGSVAAVLSGALGLLERRRRPLA